MTTSSSRASSARSPWRRATLVALTLPTAALTALTVGSMAPARANGPDPVDNPDNANATHCVLDGAALDCTVTYTYTGGEQRFVVPAGVGTVAVKAVGAAGSNDYYSYRNSAGRGAVVSGSLDVAAGSTLAVEVGGTASSFYWDDDDNPSGGFNGGGGDSASGAGGGATDLRTTPRSESGTLASRVLVAGGGGGGSYYGAGGDSGLNGSPGTSSLGYASPGQGGSQTAGGNAGSYTYDPSFYPSSPGTSGEGGSSSSDVRGAGGGGGYYGGGAGWDYTGGGGGSSLVPTGGSATVNDTGLAAQMTISYSLPITGVTLTGDDTTPAGTPAAFTTAYTDGIHHVSVGEDQRLSISPNGGRTGAACTDTGCSATKAGEYTVKTRAGSYADSRTLTVTPGTLASLALSPATASIPAGGSQGYTVTGNDEFGNDLGDVTRDATLTYTRDGDDAAQPCDTWQDTVSCEPGHGGSYRVTASITPQGATTPVVGSSTLNVGKLASTSSLTVGGSTFGGQAPSATASVGTVGGTAVPTGSVALSLDKGAAQSAPIGDDGTVEVPADLLTGLRAGAHTLAMSYGGDGDLAASSDLASFLVKQARTTTTVSSSPTALTATVTGAEPTGHVDFYIDGDQVGTGTLEDGVATWDVDTTRTTDAVVAAVYAGDDDHLGSSASSARRNPTIVATPSTTGWSKTDVTITFACTGVAAGACPTPVTVTDEGVTQPATQTVTNADGGVASVTPAVVRIDRTAPTVSIAGLKQGGVYDGSAPAPICQGADGQGSGVVTCTVSTAGGFGPVVTTATATDAAGNTATTKATYRVRDLWVDGASGGPGTWTVKRGTTALLHVVHDGKLTVLLASGTKGSARDDGKFAGSRLWTVRVSAGAKKGSVNTYTLKFSDGTSRVVRIVAG